MVALATELLGAAPRPPRRIRGLYTVWPTTHRDGAGDPLPLGPHVDDSAAHLTLCAYLTNVQPGGGGLTLWRGSALAIHDCFETSFGLKAADGPRLQQRIDEIRPRLALSLLATLVMQSV